MLFFLLSTMGNSHGHHKPSRRIKRRRSMPNLSSEFIVVPLEPDTPIMPTKETLVGPAGDKFTGDAMAAMMAHHNRGRKPVNNRMMGEEKRGSEAEVPVFDIGKSSGYDGFAGEEDELDQDVYVEQEEEKIDSPQAPKTLTLPALHNNGSRHSSDSLSRNNSSRQSSRRSLNTNSSHHSSKRIVPFPPQEHRNNNEVDHSRRKTAVLSPKPKRTRSRRRASIGSSAYNQGETALLANLGEVEAFLKTLQEKDPNVRQRFLVETLQRQAGTAKPTTKDGSSLSSSRQQPSSPSSSNEFSSSSNNNQRRKSTTNMDENIRREAALRRSSAKKRRASGMSNSTSRLHSARRSSTSDLMNNKSDHGSGKMTRSSSVRQVDSSLPMPTLNEKKSGHYPLPPSSPPSSPLPPSTRRVPKGKSKRRLTTGGDMPTLAPMTKDRSLRASTTDVPGSTGMPFDLPEQSPHTPEKKKKGKLKKGMKRLSVGDPSKLPVGDPMEFLAKKEARARRRARSRSRSSSVGRRKSRQQQLAKMDVSSNTTRQPQQMRDVSSVSHPGFPLDHRRQRVSMDRSTNSETVAFRRTGTMENSSRNIRIKNSGRKRAASSGKRKEGKGNFLRRSGTTENSTHNLRIKSSGRGESEAEESNSHRPPKSPSKSTGKKREGKRNLFFKRSGTLENSAHNLRIKHSGRGESETDEINYPRSPNSPPRIPRSRRRSLTFWMGF